MNDINSSYGVDLKFPYIYEKFENINLRINNNIV